MAGRPAVVLLIFAGLSWRNDAKPAETCKDMYTVAFKGKSSVKPKDVGNLYFQYCKKNMRVSSAKSMDELCKPMMVKAEEKMSWVPPETEVTPTIVCKTIDDLKKDYPDFALIAQEQRDAQATVAQQEQAEKNALGKKATEMSAAIVGKVKDAVKSIGVVGELTAAIEKAVSSSLGEEEVPEMERKIREKMIASIAESVTLQTRALETKVAQKTDEAIKTWVGETVKARKEEKKTSREQIGALS